MPADPDRRSARAHDPVHIRDATAADAAAIAALHADSWSRHYRGAFADSYLDGEALADRLGVWSERLAATEGTCGVVTRGVCTLVAETGGGGVPAILGFAHTVFGEDPVWGALLDNLHVDHGAQRRGIGSRLLAESARRVTGRGPGGLYLWVLEQNGAAQSFYRSLGGAFAGSRPAVGPGGDRSRLAGRPVALRCAWPDPKVLLERATRP